MKRPGAARLRGAPLLLFLLAACHPHTRSEPAELSMAGVIAPSLRGQDERAEAPPGLAERSEGRSPGRVRRLLAAYGTRSESVGQPSNGALEEGRELPELGPGFVHIGERSFGTDELVAALRFAAGTVARRYPGTVPILVADLSHMGGGPAPPHVSHQSGRDADLGYYLAENRSARSFVSALRSLDAEKTWTFLAALLSTELVQYVFIDYAVQAALYDEAVRQGWSSTALDEVFQYPAGRSARVGIIRHLRGHDDHMHVRIHCPYEDPDCND